ncbi:MAG: alpha/beta hydrolase family esterase [Chloroflexota bacterium]
MSHIRWITAILLTFIGLLAGPAALSAQTEEPEAPPVPTCDPARPANFGTSLETLLSDRLERSYRLYIPESYTGETGAPLVISLHGFGSNSRQQAEFSQWNAIAEEVGAVVVYPQGYGMPPRWNAGVIPGGGFTDDVTFINDLIDHMNASLCIDPGRVYVNGFSNGGGMSHYLACNLADQITAVGMVAGAYPTLDLPCEPGEPVPVIAFHGGADQIVPYDGSGTFFRLPPVDAWAAAWAERNGCDPEPDSEVIVEGIDRVTYSGCEDNATVVLYTIADGDHTWPGGPRLPLGVGGEPSALVDATALMWNFFAIYTETSDE